MLRADSVRLEIVFPLDTILTITGVSGKLSTSGYLDNIACNLSTASSLALASTSTVADRNFQHSGKSVGAT
jgi:hypothetical protein